MLTLRHGGEDRAHQAGRNGETDPDRAAGFRIDRGVDADEMAVEVDQRATRIAWIDCRVRLDVGAERAEAEAGARQGGDDARGHRLADAERVADSEHQVADLKRVTVGDFENGQTLLADIDLQCREVELLVGSSTVAENSRRSLSTTVI